jgi:hypothetical protein
MVKIAVENGQREPQLVQSDLEREHVAAINSFKLSVTRMKRGFRSVTKPRLRSWRSSSLSPSTDSLLTPMVLLSVKKRQSPAANSSQSVLRPQRLTRAKVRTIELILTRQLSRRRVISGMPGDGPSALELCSKARIQKRSRPCWNHHLSTHSTPIFLSPFLSHATSHTVRSKEYVSIASNCTPKRICTTTPHHA